MMSQEELDKARAKEAWRIYDGGGIHTPPSAIIAARLAREGWMPPEPVDPDVLAVRKVMEAFYPMWAADFLAGASDQHMDFRAALAAYKAGREAEAERAKVLVEPAQAIVNRAVRGTGSNDLRWPHILKAARRLEEGLNAYKAGKEAAQ